MDASLGVLDTGGPFVCDSTVSGQFKRELADSLEPRRTLISRGLVFIRSAKCSGVPAGATVFIRARELGAGRISTLDCEPPVFLRVCDFARGPGVLGGEVHWDTRGFRAD